MTDEEKDEENDPVAVIYNESHIGHKPIISSPENPKRLIDVIHYLLARTDVFTEDCQLFERFDMGSEEDILRVHTENYLQFIKNYSEQGGGILGDSTYLNKRSYKCILMAIGGAIEAANKVIRDEFAYSFALIRPPGHHASQEHYGGYCLCNNAAILARYLQDKKDKEKIMIVDWDGHAGDGTMKIFYEDPTVQTISIHRDPVDFYPHTGFIEQIGAREGRGYHMNIPIPRTLGNEEYLRVIKEIVLPVYEQYSPDFVIGCNGFDAHFSDSNVNMWLTSKGFYDIVSILKEKMRGKFTILMEGGYTPYNNRLTHTILSALIGKPFPYPENDEKLESPISRMNKAYDIYNKKLKQIKITFRDYYKF
jgi:acetoin utilization deacetylase AcuC-like enzyme